MQMGRSVQAVPSKVHWVKSISCLHAPQVWDFSNSSEKISFSSPQLGHLQVNDFRFLNCSHPGQCCGVDMVFSLILKQKVSVFRCQQVKRSDTCLSKSPKDVNLTPGAVT